MQRVLITGGSRGIGRACVALFAAEGWQVFFTYHKSVGAAKALAAQTGATAILADCTDEKQVQAAAAQAGRLSAVVCNAGIAAEGLFQDLTDADWLKMIDTNVLGAVRTLRAALPTMLHEKSGSMVLVSSIWGRTGGALESHYAASKAALIGLTHALSDELGPSGIRVNCVCPGVIDTDMNAMHDAQTMAELAARTPLGRLGQAREVAEAVLWLCGEKSSFVTGEVLGVTGGFCG